MSDQEFTQLTAFGLMTKFEPVHNSGQIQTINFLQACSELADILDEFGSGFFIAKKDMVGNIKKIEERHKSNPEKYTTINAILEEDSSAVPKKPSCAVVGLLWLRRGLDFLRAFLTELCKGFQEGVEEDSLKNTTLTAYEPTLKPFHGKMVQFLFSNVCRFVPSRPSFLKSLMKDPSATQEQVISDIVLFLPNFTSNVDLIEALLNKYGLNSSDKA